MRMFRHPTAVQLANGIERERAVAFAENQQRAARIAHKPGRKAPKVERFTERGGTYATVAEAIRAGGGVVPRSSPVAFSEHGKDIRHIVVNCPCCGGDQDADVDVGSPEAVTTVWCFSEGCGRELTVSYTGEARATGRRVETIGFVRFAEGGRLPLPTISLDGFGFKKATDHRQCRSCTQYRLAAGQTSSGGERGLCKLLRKSGLPHNVSGNENVCGAYEERVYTDDELEKIAKEEYEARGQDDLRKALLSAVSQRAISPTELGAIGAVVSQAAVVAVREYLGHPISQPPPQQITIPVTMPVSIPTPKVDVNLAAPPAPNVHVLIPPVEMSAPTVTVQPQISVNPKLTLPPRKTTKEVQYDSEGNVKRVTETETDATPTAPRDHLDDLRDLIADPSTSAADRAALVNDINRAAAAGDAQAAEIVMKRRKPKKS